MSAVPDIAIGVREGRKGYSMALLIFGVLFVAGAALLAYLLITAPDSVPWAFLVANFIFVLGISQFGVAFSAIMRICRTDWGRPFLSIGRDRDARVFPDCHYFVPADICIRKGTSFLLGKSRARKHISVRGLTRISCCSEI